MTLWRLVRRAWGTCPACGSYMTTNSEGVESCSDKTCRYHRG